MLEYPSVLTKKKKRKFVNSKRPEGCGFIVRTVCAGQPIEVLQQDMDYLINIWESINEKKVKNKAPSLLHSDFNVAMRVIRLFY